MKPMKTWFAHMLVAIAISGMLTACNCGRGTEKYLVQTCNFSKDEATTYYRDHPNEARSYQTDGFCPDKPVSIEELQQQVAQLAANDQQQDIQIQQFLDTLDALIAANTKNSEAIQAIRDNLETALTEEANRNKAFADAMRDLAETLSSTDND